MPEALRAARDAARRGEVPVGAVLVGPDGRRLSSGSNRTLRDTDPTAHAEIVTLRRAARRVGNHRLIGATLFCTLEPCSMCLGAMVQARIRRLVYGAADAKGGGIGHGRLNWSGANHRFSILGGVLEEASAELLRHFFRSRRR
ncbi:MAG: tRNA adenosine(34) deaminase TadA [Acidobacteriota bacterium]